ncbi:MAG: hypothetical protein ACXQTJ_02315 [Candidatus Syntropharchaeales archaeon]
MALLAMSLIPLLPMMAAVTASIIPATQVIESQGTYFTVNYDNVTIHLDGREATIIKGQEVHFFNETGASCGIVTLEGISGDAEDETEESDPDGVLDSSKTSGMETGKYNATADCDGCKPTIIKVTTTSFKLDLKRGSKSVAGKKLPQGTSFRIEFKNSLDSYDGVSLRVENPSGDILKANPADGTVFDHVNVEHLENLEINTTGWDLGEYKFKILTEEEYARGFSEESSEKTLEIIKSEISIEAEKDKVAELERLKLTITGAPGRSINISVARSCEFAKFPAGVNDNPSDGATGSFTDELDDLDGENVYSIYFERSGPYTIEVRYPDTGEMDSVDVSVVKKKALLDVPDTCVIGDDLRINGTVNTGNTVDIAIDNWVILIDAPVDSQGHFAEDLPTPRTPGTAVEGDIEIKVFIDTDLKVGDDVSDLKCDGSAVVTLLEGSLSLDRYPRFIARGDTLTISGTAPGYDSVDLIVISPKGGGGDGLSPSESELEGLPPGITYYSESTYGEDNSFSFDIDVQDGADEGKYLFFILVPGKDGVYGRMRTPYLLDGIKDRYAGGDLMNLAGKMQDEFDAILRDATCDSPGSDDIVKMIEVEIAEGSVRLDPIEDVVIGNDLVVAGFSNREGSQVAIRVYGAMDLGRKLAQVEDGRFRAVFDTVEAVTGKYTVEVDDRNGHTDTTTVNIVVPTPVRTSTPTPLPTPTFMATPAAITPAPTTVPEIGGKIPEIPKVNWFVILIAILLLFGLLGIVYLVRR